MPFITNVSMADAINGRFPDWANENTILIQIQDVDSYHMGFANVKNRSRFIATHQFRFDDTDEGDNVISEIDARHIGYALMNAQNMGWNVVVHCHAGLCRSGAVTEVAVMMGFEDIDNNPRVPNVTVKNLLRKAVGLTNSWEEYNDTRNT